MKRHKHPFKKIRQTKLKTLESLGLQVLSYEIKLVLEEKYGDDLLCPYSRNITIARKSNEIICSCAVGDTCRSNIPMDYHNCKKYREALK